MYLSVPSELNSGHGNIGWSIDSTSSLPLPLPIDFNSFCLVISVYFDDTSSNCFKNTSIAVVKIFITPRIDVSILKLLLIIELNEFVAPIVTLALKLANKLVFLVTKFSKISLKS